ncbi:MAG: type III-B CRISPR-associated protein Cas10/Cmr2, partial [Flavobacteriales bacterium]|nr:type III-B CRISPR-associated protein Cas10/Cmr2 [Flavobacteriales bacterium]
MPEEKNNTHRYLAISIGPVCQTIMQARKTRELWAASFLFSKIMKLLIAELNGKVDILSPIKSEIENEELYGAGVYSDRLFALTDNLTERQLEDAKINATSKLAKLVLPDSLEDKLSEAIVFWSKYFRIVHVFETIDASEENVLIALNECLDTLELQPVYFEVEPDINFLIELLDNPYKTKLVEVLIERGSYENLMLSSSLFPSTGEIAALELFQDEEKAYKQLREEAELERKEQQKEQQEDTDEEEDYLDIFYEKLFSKEKSPLYDKAESYHKYFCIVHVDGDSFGELNKGLKDHEAIKDFSKELSKYAAEAAKTINDYGGKPVYIGGDDLVFFTPVRTQQGTVFDLIKALDDKFKDRNKNSDYGTHPTLSFGLTISYYKYPLFEARNLSFDQLFKRAKKLKREDGREKDAIALRLLKHSGSFFECIFGKEDLSYLTGFNSANEAIPEILLSS